MGVSEVAGFDLSIIQGKTDGKGRWDKHWMEWMETSKH